MPSVLSEIRSDKTGALYVIAFFRNVVLSTGGSASFSWAISAIEQISEIVSPLILYVTTIVLFIIPIQQV